MIKLTGARKANPFSQERNRSHLAGGRTQAFTLVEMAVVLVVVGLLMSLLLGPLVAQQQQKQIGDTKRQLEEIKEAVFGFAMANGRLPCPARPNTTNGAEDCSLSVGVMPWSVLGVKENDAWGHRFTYYVTPYFSDPISACTYASTVANCPDSPTSSSFAIHVPTAGYGLLTINNAASGTITKIADNVPMAVLSHGPSGRGAYLQNGGQITGASVDEAENSNGDTTLVSRAYDDIDSTGNGFTHLVAWIPITTLTNRMVAAGRLP